VDVGSDHGVQIAYLRISRNNYSGNFRHGRPCMYLLIMGSSMLGYVFAFLVGKYLSQYEQGFKERQQGTQKKQQPRASLVARVTLGERIGSV
jgi:hypothetical protein